MSQRTELVNALRSHLYEFGYIVAKGINHLHRLEEIVENERNELPAIVRDSCRGLLEQIERLTVRSKPPVATALPV